MYYAEPEARSRDDSGVVVDASVHRYSGSTRGVDWVIEASLIAQQDIIGEHHVGEAQRGFIRWTAPGAGTATHGGGALLLMNLQGSAQGAAADVGAPGGGLMAALVDKAAALALLTYARMAFGTARTKALVWGQSDGQIRHLLLPAGEFSRVFRAFGSSPALLAHLGPPARDWLLRAHHLEVALLWDSHGLTLRWPGARIDPDQVAACAEYGVSLLGLLRDCAAPAPMGPGA